MSIRLAPALMSAASLFLFVGPALAQTPPPRSGQLIRPVPVPVQPQTQVQPRRPEDGLTPTGPRTNLPVSSFSHSGLRCAADLGSATSQINAQLVITPGLTIGGQVSVDVLVDGVSAGPQSLWVRNGRVGVNRRINLAGSDGEHQVVFVMDGVRSEPQTFSHACVTGTAIQREAPGQLTLPNLAFGELLYAELVPLRPPSRDQSGGRVSFGTINVLGNPVIVRNLRSTTGQLRLPSPGSCPAEADAFANALIAITIDPQRVSDPATLFAASTGVSGMAQYIDTRDGPRLANGMIPGSSERIQGTPLPQGYQWIVFSTPLACTRNGVLEMSFDGGNSLRETSEADNTLRVRYSTVP